MMAVVANQTSIRFYTDAKLQKAVSLRVLLQTAQDER
jgi:hypothetical protein